MVLINFGIMEKDNYSILKPIRGNKLPLEVTETSSASEIKILATDKHASHNPNFCELEDYVLLHPDGTKMVTSLGTQIGTGDKNKEKIHIM